MLLEEAFLIELLVGSWCSGGWCLTSLGRESPVDRGAPLVNAYLSSFRLLTSRSVLLFQKFRMFEYRCDGLL